MKVHGWMIPFMLAAVVPVMAAPPAPREVKRTFAVQPGCTVVVDSYRGSITVEESEEPVVKVSVYFDVDAETDARAERMRDEVQLELAAQHNTVRVTARNPRASGIRLVWNEEDRLDLIYRISVPRQCNLEVKARLGSITVGNLAGRMVAQLEEGDIFFRRIEGSVDARTELGDIIVSRCSGPVTARALRGVIRVGTIGGWADVKTSSGDIEIMVAKTGVTASAEAGDVTVGFAPTFSADSRVSVSGGNIRAKIHADASCRVEASSVWGRVKSTLPLTVESGGSGERHLMGKLNKGGPLVWLRASGGDVTLSSDVVLFDGS